MKTNEVKWGAVLSYVLIFLNATYGLFLTPYILGQIGEASYGVYKTVSAFTSSLMVLDLGLGGTMMRYIAKYRADRQENKIPNFISMGLIQTGVICTVIGVVTSVLYLFLDDIYSNGLTTTEILEAKRLYLFLAIGILAHVFENLFNGIICGFNCFTFANGIKVSRLLVRIAAVVVFLGIFKDSLTLVVVDLVITILAVLAEAEFMLLKLRIKAEFTHWDKTVFSESFKYTILMFLTSIVAQVNTNFSNVVIGAVLNSTAVTVYSMAVLIFGTYEQMSTAISGVMLPTITNSLKNDDEHYSNTLKIVVEMGRIQFILLGAVFVGFITLGKPFINMWLGADYDDVYYLVLILLGPALLELCINVCLSILRAKNMLGFRTAVIIVSTVLNLVITIVGMPCIGFYSAAIGTACSFLFGSVITMGIYYYQSLRINILKLYRGIFNRIWICLVLSGIVCFGVSMIFDTPVTKFILGFCAFCITYAFTLLVFGLNEKEKTIILSKMRRKND